MTEIVQHDNNSDSVVKIGDDETPITLKIYQDVYHQVTGRTEKIRERYSDNLLIDLCEIEQLHFKIMQLCDVYNIVANNETVSVFHSKERKEEFTSFERFKSYNSSSSRPVISVVLKYNFSIIPANLQKPQEYTVTVRLISRVTLIKEMQEEAPPFMRGRLYNFVAPHTAEISVEYADYIIARSFLESFKEWVDGCKKKKNSKFLEKIQQVSHMIPTTVKLILAALFISTSLKALPEFFIDSNEPLQIARLILIFCGGFYLLMLLAESFGKIIEHSIDSFTEISYLKINKGDENLIEDFTKSKSKIFRKFIYGSLATIILGIISSKLALLV